MFIAALPKVLGLLRQLTQPKPVAEDPPAAGVVVEDGSDMDQILQAAIAFVMDAERERNMEGDVTVMNRPEPSSWALSDKMRTFPTRVN